MKIEGVSMLRLLIMPKTQGCYWIASCMQILKQKGVSSVGIILSSVSLASAGCDHWNTMAMSLEVCTSKRMLTNGKLSKKTHIISKSSGDYTLQTDVRSIVYLVSVSQSPSLQEGIFVINVHNSIHRNDW